MTRDWRSYWQDVAQKFRPTEPLRQVLRVQNGAPVDADDFASCCRAIIDELVLEPEHRVLDLCCGNGLLTEAVAAQCRNVVGIDFCLRLLTDAPVRGRTGIQLVNGDARALDFLRDFRFDRILLGAALQHFEPGEAVALFQRLRRLLGPDGLLIVTDVLDVGHKWHFFDSPEREAAYFSGLAASEPVLGTWFDRRELEKLARFAGFASVKASDCPPASPYGHYRFDLQARVSP